MRTKISETEKLTRLGLVLPDSARLQAEKVAYEKRVSLSQVVREALFEYLSKYCA